MTTIEKAIERMEKQEAACNELIAMAEKDLAHLRRRRNNARRLIESFQDLTDEDWKDLHETIKGTAERLVNREPYQISCMGTGIWC